MRGAQSLLTSHSEALWSTYKPLTRPDDVLLARLLKPQVRLCAFIQFFDRADWPCLIAALGCGRISFDACHTAAPVKVLASCLAPPR